MSPDVCYLCIATLYGNFAVRSNRTPLNLFDLWCDFVRAVLEDGQMDRKDARTGQVTGKHLQ